MAGENTSSRHVRRPANATARERDGFERDGPERDGGRRSALRQFSCVNAERVAWVGPTPNRSSAPVRQCGFRKAALLSKMTAASAAAHLQGPMLIMHVLDH